MEKGWLFYAWWLLINGVRDYLAVDFLSEAEGREGRRERGRRKWTWSWLGLSLVMTLAAIRFSVSGMFLIHMLCLLVFARWVLQMRWTELAGPAAVLFTLATFTEGMSAAALSWLSSSVRLSDGGAALQIFISFLSVLVFFVGLQRVRGRRLDILHRMEPQFLYFLLLPCGGMILLIRVCLRLDSPALEEYLSFIGEGAGLAVAFVMGAALFLFFLILEMSCRMMILTGEKRWAGERNERLRSFQHDVDNHLLVLSGLLGEQRYREAAVYADGLCGRAAALPAFSSSGRAGLDILLQEKLDLARENGIEASCEVRIPGECAVEEMDLCGIFANLLDNALHGCQEYVRAGGRNPHFSVKVSVCGRTILIECENTADFPETEEKGGLSRRKGFREGTGLGNIRRIAKRYQGAVEVEAGDGRFRISVLLCF